MPGLLALNHFHERRRIHVTAIGRASLAFGYRATFAPQIPVTDIVIVGEMRNPETISTAMEMADTGHKVFSTLHTGSAIESIDRIVAEYPTAEQDRVRHRLADVLRCIVSQKLCPKIGGGRVLAKDVLWMDSSSRAAIKNGNTGEIYQMMWEGSKAGMTTLEQDLLRLTKQRLITPETAVDFANNKRRMQQLLR